MTFDITHINCPHLDQPETVEDVAKFKTVVAESGNTRHWVSIEFECEFCGARIKMDMEAAPEEQI